MGFWEHLNELRGTIIKSGSVFLVFAGLIGYYLVQFNRLLMWPFQRAAAEYPGLVLELGTQSPMEGVNVIIEVCMVGSLFLSLPFILYFVGQFVAPALTEKESRAVLPLCLSSLFLFVAGTAFAFFVIMPAGMRVFIEINRSFDWSFRWTVGSYYTVLIRTVLGVGATFQFPLLIVLLVWLGVLSTAALRKYRRHAIVVVFVVAMIVTPSTDPFNQVFVALPMCVLYEIAILVSRQIEKRRDRSGTAVVLALLALCVRSSRQRRATAERTPKTVPLGDGLTLGVAQS
jgi:sec-independent protein translocase protein TatC